MIRLDGKTFRIGRIQGIEVSAHWSLLFMLALLILRDVLTLPWVFMALSLATSALFFGSILVHELAHSMVARQRGYRTLGIVLHAFGGQATIGGAMTPRDSRAVALAGPISNGLLWLMFNGLANVIPSLHARWVFEGAATLNLFLGLFNLIPAPPLDGGQVLLESLRMRMGSPAAERRAFTIGMWIAAPLMVLGLMINQVMLALIFLISFQTCQAGAAAVGGTVGWRDMFSGGRPGHSSHRSGGVVIDWNKYQPVQKSWWERLKSWAKSVGGGPRNTPPRTPILRVVNSDVDDDRPTGPLN